MDLDLSDKAGSIELLLTHMERHLSKTGQSEAEFSRAVNSSNALFKNLRNGSLPSADRLHQILCELGQSMTLGNPDYLASKAEAIATHELNQTLSGTREAQAALTAAQGGKLALPPAEPPIEVSIEGHHFDTVPRYDARAAGGSGALNLDEDPIDRLAFNKEWLKKQGIHAGHCALITAQGRSMEPRIYDGDLIMIDRRRTSIRSGGVYVFNDGDRGTRVKQLEHIPDLGVILHSDNREEYPPETRTGQAANDITILGEVVWSGHKWG